MKSNLEELARQAAAYQVASDVEDLVTVARKQKKKKLAILMLILNGISFILVGVGFFFDLLVCTLIGAVVALASFVVSRICKRI